MITVKTQPMLYQKIITSAIYRKINSNIMKLSQTALKAINNPATRRRLMDVLGCTEFTIARYIQKNSDNLTKAAALKVILLIVIFYVS